MLAPMPTGPSGQKRPADVVGCAVTVMKIATGQMDETKLDETKQRDGRKGGHARAAKLSAERRREIARRAAAKRWGN